MQAKVKTARRPIQHTVERPALLKIRLRSGADFLTQRNDLNRRGRRASMHGFEADPHRLEKSIPWETVRKNLEEREENDQK
jgi:hypothetical protein